MKTVYLDEQFALELLVDYFLLLGTAKLCALPFRRGRFLLGAALGAAWSTLGLLPGLSWLRLPAMRLVLAAAMTLAAFGGERKLWRCLAGFLGVSALFGGAVYAAALLRGGPGGGPLLRLDMRVLALSFALCWAAVSLLFRGSAKSARRRILDMTVERAGQTVRLRALEDTGNGLYDPISGCGVFVAEAAALGALFPASDPALLRGPPTEAVLRIPGTRLVPYAALEGGGRLLLAFRPDRVTVEGRERPDLIAAVAPASLGADGSYDAIISPSP